MDISSLNDLVDLSVIHSGVVAVLLLIAGFMDYKSREVNPLYWLLAIAIGTPIAVYVYYSKSLRLDLIVLNTGLSLLVVSITYMLYKKCMIGGGDVLALLFLSLSSPVIVNSIFPGPYLAIIYSTIPGIIYHLYSAHIACGKLQCYFRLTFDIPARRLIEDPRFKWWIVLENDEEADLCGIDVDAPDAARIVSKGELDRVLKATPGHPYITHLAIGYVLAIILKDAPIIYFLPLPS